MRRRRRRLELVFDFAEDLLDDILHRQDPDRRPLAAVLTGRDPFAENGRCDPETELKMGIYVLEGPTARAVLDWPVASCALGRASSVVLDGDGALTLGFASGATIDFIWSGDHFERTEIG